MVQGSELRRRFAAIDKAGRLHFTDDVKNIELSVLDGNSQDPALRDVFFALHYILETVRLLQMGKSIPSRCALLTVTHVLLQVTGLTPLPKAAATKSIARASSSKAKTEQPEELDSDIEILPGPPPAKPNPLQDAILRWLEQHRDGYYHTHPVVCEIRGNIVKIEDDEAQPMPQGNAKGNTKAKPKGKDKGEDKVKDKVNEKKDECCCLQSFTHLQTWIKIIAELNTITKTNNMAEPIVRHKKISQIVIGHFFNHSHDWVNNCCYAQSLLTQHGKDPTIQALTVSLENNALGVNNLLERLCCTLAKQASEAEAKAAGKGKAKATHKAKAKAVGKLTAEAEVQDEDYKAGEGPLYVEVDNDSSSLSSD